MWLHGVGSFDAMWFMKEKYMEEKNHKTNTWAVM